MARFVLSPGRPSSPLLCSPLVSFRFRSGPFGSYPSRSTFVGPVWQWLVNEGYARTDFWRVLALETREQRSPNSIPASSKTIFLRRTTIFCASLFTYSRASVFVTAIGSPRVILAFSGRERRLGSRLRAVVPRFAFPSPALAPYSDNGRPTIKIFRLGELAARLNAPRRG